MYPTSTTNALGQTTQIGIHPGLGVLSFVRDVNKIESTWQYDGFGRLKSTSPAGGEAASLSYSFGDTLALGGLTITSSHAGGGQIATTYDRLGRQRTVSTLDPDGHPIAATRTYDDLGRLNSSRDAFPLNANISTYSYDDLGRITSLIHADGSESTWTYDKNTVTFNDELNHDKSVTYDLLGRAVSSTEHRTEEATATVTTSYGEFGLVREVDDPAGNSKTFEYDRLGRPSALSDLDRGRRSNEYDAFGNVVKTTDPLASVTHFYDALGRLDHDVGPDAIQLVWDKEQRGIGKIAKAISADATTSYAYDSVGHVRSIQETVGTTSIPAVEQTFDSLGRPETISYPSVPGHDRLVIRNSYDSRGYPLSITDERPGRNADIWRRGTSNPISGELTDTILGGVGLKATYEPGRGTLHRRQVTDALGAAVQESTYDLDLNGTLKTLTNTGAVSSTEEFSYDSMNRISTWASQGGTYQYAYDSIGNYLGRTALSASAPLADFVNTYDRARGAGPSAVSGSTWGANTYDAKGNQTDAPGRHVSFTTFDLPKTVDSGGVTLRFGYDANRTRVLKNDGVTNIVTVPGLYERRVTGLSTAHTFYVPVPAGAVAQMSIDGNGSESMSAVVLDHLGSPSVLVNSAGSVLERFRFEPFGQRLDPSAFTPIAPSTGTNLTFGGHFADRDLGLVDMGGRIYDPRAGRFLTADPVVANPLSIQTANSYTYARNCPSTFVDPSGFSDEDSVLLRIYTPDGTLNSINTVTMSSGFTSSPGTDVTIDYVPVSDDWASATALGNVANLPTAPNGGGTVPGAFRPQPAGGDRVVVADNSPQRPDLLPDPFRGNVTCYDTGCVRAPGLGFPVPHPGAAGMGFSALWNEFMALFRGAEAAAASGAAAGAGAAATGVTFVLGTHPEYVEEAEALGLEYFGIHSEVWNALGTVEAQWEANKQALDAMIAQGGQFLLVIGERGVQAGSFLSIELTYLVSQGYVLNAAGNMMVRGGP
jgi:RHS repeat-associated protein